MSLLNYRESKLSFCSNIIGIGAFNFHCKHTWNYGRLLYVS